MEESPYLSPAPSLPSLYFSVLGLSRKAPIVDVGWLANKRTTLTQSKWVFSRSWAALSCQTLIYGLICRPAWGIINPDERSEPLNHCILHIHKLKPESKLIGVIFLHLYCLSKSVSLSFLASQSTQCWSSRPDILHCSDIDNLSLPCSVALISAE